MKGLYIELLTHGRGAGFFVWGPHRKERAFIIIIIIIDPPPLSLIFKKTVPMRNPDFYVGTLSVTSQVQTFLISLGMAENAA